jgi:hypothetical protein
MEEDIIKKLTLEPSLQVDKMNSMYDFEDNITGIRIPPQTSCFYHNMAGRSPMLIFSYRNSGWLTSMVQVWKAISQNIMDAPSKERIKIFLSLLERVLEFGTAKVIIPQLNQMITSVTRNSLSNLLGTIIHYFSTSEEIDIIASCCKCLRAYIEADPVEGEHITRELIQREYFSKV